MTPLLLLRKWLLLAKMSNIPKANAMCLSTISVDNKPSSRMILFEDVLDRSFVFFTDNRSQKANHLLVNPFASCVIYWPTIKRQIRLEGEVKKLNNERAKKNFNAKTKAQKIAILSSCQSSVLSCGRSRSVDYEREALNWSAKTFVPKPDFWEGYVFIANYIEYFKGENDRLNKRLVIKLEENGTWRTFYLAP